MAEPLKNFYSPDTVRLMSRVFQRNWPAFNGKIFETEILAGFDALELKQRARRITDALVRHMPPDFEEASDLITRSLKTDPDEEPVKSRSAQEGITGWATVPIGDYVALTGRDHFDLSLDMLKRLTPHLSSEFAIRPFLRDETERTLAVMQGWISSPDRHVRRLVSEGTRPRLPWAPKLTGFIENPEPILPLLDALKDDPADYVRKSVANNLNDIAKDHPDVVVDIARTWLPDADRNRQRLIRHACRTLVKNGYRPALDALGFDKPEVRLEHMAVTPRVVFGDGLTIDVRLVSTGSKPQDLVLDYVIHHRKANGSTSPKTFKWRTGPLAAGGTLELEKRHAIREITTRKYYPGEHRVEIQVNGTIIGSAPFELVFEHS